MKKSSITVFVALLLLVPLGAVARAQPSQGSYRQEVQEQRYEGFQQRVDLVIARFNNNKDRHITAYNNIKTRVQEIVKALSAKGYDTSKLTDDLQTWDAMVVKAAQDYVTFISKLEATKAYEPGAGGQLAAALDEARAALGVVHGDFLDVRTYYQTTVRPDVAALKQQQPAGSQ